MKDYSSIYEGTPPFLTVQFRKSPRQEQYKDMFSLTFFPYFTYSSFTFTWLILTIIVFGCCLWLNDNSRFSLQLYKLSQKALFPLGQNYPFYTLKQKQYYRLLTSLLLFKNFIHISVSLLLILSLGSYVERVIDWKKTFLLILLSGFCGTLCVCLFQSKPSIDGFTPICGLLGYMIGYMTLRWKHWVKYSNERVHMLLGIMGSICVGLYFGLYYEMVSLVSQAGAYIFGFFFSLEDDTERKGWTVIRVLALVVMISILGLLLGFIYFKANPIRV